MKVHHLDCATCCPLGGRWLDGHSRGLTSRMVSHCLLIETGRDLVLIDTGLGLADVRRPWRRLHPSFLLMNNYRLRRRDTAIEQVRALGHDPRDVRHVVLTHLDFDHAGGIADFPWARVHVTAAELAVAIERRGRWDRRRYRPVQWAHAPDWALHDFAGERWHGFDAVRQLDGLPPEILLLSLIGHTPGHAGVAVDRGAGWLLHAGDAYVHHAEMARDGDWPRVVAYQGFLDHDRDVRLANQARLRALAQDHVAGVRVFCAHDPVEFDALARADYRSDAGRSIQQPVAAARSAASTTA